jgi:hypothetical protein
MNSQQRPPHPDPAILAEIELEGARWAEIEALADALTPEERAAPGYFANPAWSVKDLVAHLGSWQAAARSELLDLAIRAHAPHDFEIDRRNAETLAAHMDDTWDMVWSETKAARAWMLEAWLGLQGRSSEADRWVRKAGAEHYDEHLDRLRMWTAELIALRAHPRMEESDP